MPYDAELFGHWWFEGIWWIGRLVRMFAQDDEIEMTHCREYFQNNGMPTQSIELPEGSWGLKVAMQYGLTKILLGPGNTFMKLNR